MTFAAEGICKAYNGRAVLTDVGLSVRGGETLAVVGRSGCGKTTLLRVLAGLLTPDAGEVWLDGQPVRAPGKDRLLVFQGLEQLLPWQTLLGNVLFAVRKTRPNLTRAAAQALAEHCLSEMGLANAMRLYPYQLSGGMKQRGALARAMAVAPRVLLMDEPFSSLDEYTREAAHASFDTLKKATGAAVVLVTHDLREAAALASRIALLTPGGHGFSAMVERAGPSELAVLRERLKEQGEDRYAQAL